jgi:RES domain-containing protein
MHKWVALSVAAGEPPHILSGLWAMKNGGRFNFPNRYRTTYISLEPLTAQLESERGVVAPFVHVPIAGNLQRVLRLDDAAVRAYLQLDQAELDAEWRFENAAGRETLTQELGHSAYNTNGIEAIAYPSQMNAGGVCVAVFPDRLTAATSLRIDDPDNVISEEIPDHRMLDRFA